MNDPIKQLLEYYREYKWEQRMQSIAPSARGFAAFMRWLEDKVEEPKAGDPAEKV